MNEINDIDKMVEKSSLLPEFMRNKIIIDIISVAIVVLVCFFALKLVHKIIIKFFNRNKKKINRNSAKLETLIKVFYSTARVIIIFIAITIILDIFGINTSSLIATAGIGGIAIALGAQTLIADFVKGIFIIFDDKLRVGEWVVCSGVEGTVEEVNLRITKIRDYNGSLHIIPNSNITNVQNYNRGAQRSEAYFCVSNDTKLEDVKAMIETVSQKIKNMPKYKKAFIEDLSFFEITEFKDFSYKVRVTSLVKIGTQWEISRKVRELIKIEMEKRNIKSSLLEEEIYEKI
ncbi:mechanosensitive ion channel family protein [Anaerococcus hydrogenalis]|uniref:Mechanosensitive ion channel family protein n=1 Tax=Anaerococcus hydrogenalis TaxID=33029 RepID=A0A2N6UHN7_9FIRM|nr:mechanosensitive ion channel family protein [Anaerococcus hydrogenalis]MDK7695443.1 mechanosensitive ion channel family protein [Anaerococcus hydrogenalis]MDK7697327.1 mechanosensitive ion channel family protein [Anaerococcus hydrogenalis]MDK7708470.1 mechanosensitive ion channel family protein [Anaerococcus hydrogenalis]PMC81096.1 mechanosensitive ion channel family protein [Anaerococcus hydrogenalis]